MPGFTFSFVMFFAHGGHATCNPLSLTERLMHETHSQEPGGPGHTDMRRRKKKIRILKIATNFDFHVNLNVRKQN